MQSQQSNYNKNIVHVLCDIHVLYVFSRGIWDAGTFSQTTVDDNSIILLIL